MSLCFVPFCFDNNKTDLLNLLLRLCAEIETAFFIPLLILYLKWSSVALLILEYKLITQKCNPRFRSAVTQKIQYKNNFKSPQDQKRWK